MKKQAGNNIKLGVFVMAGLAFLILLLYMIGRNRNLFGATFPVKVRFNHVQGLLPGNNVRYAGLQAGTVRKVRILCDTLIEVEMAIDRSMKQFIPGNAIASIGTDGLIGNRVINISPAGGPRIPIRAGDVLTSRRAIDTDDMLQVLNKTNNDVALIAENLKATILRLNNSTALWTMLNDNSLPQSLRASGVSLQLATARAASMMGDLHSIVSDIKQGKGTVGALLYDTAIAHELQETLVKIKAVGAEANHLALAIDTVVIGLSLDVNQGKGPVHALLKDSGLVIKLNTSLDNIQQGTANFSENMEALKHNFLFRGYFRKQEKQKRKEQARMAKQ
jgi:phospholipid/cholesterol/gamma-HCH transport system substrate-binding protein